MCCLVRAFIDITASVPLLCGWLFTLMLQVTDLPDRSFAADYEHSIFCVIIWIHGIILRHEHAITRQARAIKLICCMS